MFQKILVPIDGSEHSIKALDVAIGLAKQFGGKITLLYAYSITFTPVMAPEPSTMTSPTTPILSPVDLSKVTDYARETGKRILQEGEDKVKAANVPVDSTLKEGHTVQEIVSSAQKGSYDLIVIGARGVSHVREMLLGSTTDGVIHHASCPILVVK